MDSGERIRKDEPTFERSAALPGTRVSYASGEVVLRASSSGRKTGFEQKTQRYGQPREIRIADQTPVRKGQFVDVTYKRTRRIDVAAAISSVSDSSNILQSIL